MTVKEFIEEWQSEEPYIVAHTSGSTGKPKAIKLQKEDMRTSARATNAFFCIGKDSVLALPLSVDYIAGKMMVVRALEARCRLLELPVSSTINVADIFEAVDLLSVVPAQLPGLIAQPDATQKIRNLLLGGSPVSSPLAAATVSAGFNAYIGYGMTETCSHVALSELADTKRVYRAMPGISFRRDNRECLIIDAPGFSFGSLVTNDIVDLVAPDAFIWRGRYDSAIISGGIKLFPEELERLYAPALSDFEYCVASAPDEKWGAVVVLLVVCGDNEINSIREAVERYVPDHYRRPKHYMAVDALPRTDRGKIVRTVNRIC